ncbi:MAG: hypothetical protein HYX89_08250 [Chloroflexi bacterium]|nr:hypothetical protein [Chloroflexota bacterium]
MCRSTACPQWPAADSVCPAMGDSGTPRLLIEKGIDEPATRIGYAISFTRYFYRAQPLRTLAEIRADIEALERETEGLLGEVLVDVQPAGDPGPRENSV